MHKISSHFAFKIVPTYPCLGNIHVYNRYIHSRYTRIPLYQFEKSRKGIKLSVVKIRYKTVAKVILCLDYKIIRTGS